MIETKEQRNDRQHEEDLLRLKKFRPMDETFMRGLFKDNMPLAELVLRIIIQKPDLTLIRCETQANTTCVTGAKSICLNAYATDCIGKKYDFKILKADKDANPHRDRYISSVLSMENLDENQDYSDLPDTYVIFITENDYFKKGNAVYQIQKMNLATGIPFNDGLHIVYVNGTYRDDTDIGKLMHDFNCSNADDMNFELIASKTRYLKENPEGVREMCKVMEELRNESYGESRMDNYKENFMEGREKQAKSSALKLNQKGYSPAEISEIVEFDIATVEQWLSSDLTNKSVL